MLSKTPDNFYLGEKAQEAQAILSQIRDYEAKVIEMQKGKVFNPTLMEQYQAKIKELRGKLEIDEDFNKLLSNETMEGMKRKGIKES